MNEEQKSKLLARLKEGRAKVKAAREDAKAKGLPDPKPRKKRNAAVVNPSSAPSDNDAIAPIDAAPNDAKNTVAAMPPDPGATKSKPIDVPNLPGEGKEVASKKDIVKDGMEVPEAAPKKGIASSGKPKKVEDNDMLKNEETGNQVIEANFPGQKESIKKVLKENKKENKPLAAAPNPTPANKTVKNVKAHVPDMKAVEARAPFSFSAIRKVLYQ
jgi:hypothetical protein